MRHDDNTGKKPMKEMEGILSMWVRFEILALWSSTPSRSYISFRLLHIVNDLARNWGQ